MKPPSVSLFHWVEHKGFCKTSYMQKQHQLDVLENWLLKNYSPGDDPSRDQTRSPSLVGGHEVNLLKGHVNSPSKKGQQQNYQGHNTND